MRAVIIRMGDDLSPLLGMIDPARNKYTGNEEF
jgi:hypothetical protein